MSVASLGSHAVGGWCRPPADAGGAPDGGLQACSWSNSLRAHSVEPHLVTHARSRPAEVSGGCWRLQDNALQGSRARARHLPLSMRRSEARAGLTPSSGLQLWCRVGVRLGRQVLCWRAARAPGASSQCPHQVAVPIAHSCGIGSLALEAAGPALPHCTYSTVRPAPPCERGACGGVCTCAQLGLQHHDRIAMRKATGACSGMHNR